MTQNPRGNIGYKIENMEKTCMKENLVWNPDNYFFKNTRLNAGIFHNNDFSMLAVLACCREA